MKLRLSALLLLIAHTLFSQNYHDTQGKLEISNSGQATYTLPIAMPASLKNVGPVINLTYASGQISGIAGQGWNISSISNISRMATKRDIEGFVDGVDFDDNDKLAFEGQRLILKSGTYWTDGSTYETEVQSNTKFELKGSGTAIYFIVTAPDGSRSWYGNYGGMNATDLTSYYIVRFEDPNGNYMTYHYTKPFDKNLCVSEIQFSANTAGLTPINKIVFNYVAAKRSESAYVKGVKYEKAAILNNIEVKTNDLLFKKYQLTHVADPVLGYEKVTQLQEFNGALEPANPVLFEYESTQTTVEGSEKVISYTNNLDFNDVELSGDFDGDGKLDFTTDSQLYTKLFETSGGGTVLNLPFSGEKRQKFTATTISNNKLNQVQSFVYANETNSTTEFKVYNYNGTSSITNDYTKTISIDNTTISSGPTVNDDVICGSPTHPNCIYDDELVCSSDGKKHSTKYLEGDFNGDGISEVLIINRKNETSYLHNTTYHITGFPDIVNCKDEISNPTANIEHYILDLNPNASSVLGSAGFVKLGIDSRWVLGNLEDDSIRSVADFNGDGKTDIFVLDEYGGSYKVIGFKQLTAAPWVEFEILGQGTITNYTKERQILFGDYNGDGKTDLMIPSSTGNYPGQTEWSIYYSNPNLDHNEFFAQEYHNIVEYWPHSQGYFESQTHFNRYYSLDTNSDGKSDLVKVWIRYYKPNWTVNDHDTEWKVETYVNNIGNTAVTGNKFTKDYSSPCIPFETPGGTQYDCEHWSDSPQLPVPIASKYKYHGLNTELLMVRNHTNSLTYVDFTKDVSKELLKKVTASAGNIVDEITYAPMEPTTALNNGQGLLNEFYSSSNSLDYPNVEIKKLPTSYLVSQLKNTVEGVVRLQDFRYNGFVVNMHGLGTIGFNKTARSTWYKNGMDGEKRIWSVSESNPFWRGAVKRTYMQMFAQGNLFSFVNSEYPTGIINSTTSDFSYNTVNNVFRIYLNNQITTDYLSGVVNETHYTYDSTYLLPTTIVSKNLLGTTLQGTSTTTNVFDNNPGGAGAAYYIGRPTSTKTVASAYSDTFETSQEFFYTNNFLTQVKKKGNTTDAKYLIEDFEYDTYGNVKKKTVSSSGYSTPTPIIGPRSTEYTYDASGRYIATSKDSEGLISTNNAFHPLYGIVLSSTNPFGLTTTTELDNWGKVKKITDYLGKSNTITYAKSGTEYIVTKTGDDDSESETISDALGRVKKTGVRNIDYTWSYKAFQYDFLGRKYKETEPSTPTYYQWNTTEFDDYNRIVKEIKASGLITTIAYSGLTVTGTDQYKTVSSTKNANGHVVSATDNGGTINYTYYANGNLKTSNFESTLISTEYNEWGNRIKLTDPSAGVYETSSYSTGEVYKETTPNGVTTFNLDPVTGKLLTKSIVGTNTNSVSTYSYDPTSKLLVGINFNDIQGGNNIIYTYEYDSFKRIKRTLEKSSGADFEHIVVSFDAFGRPVVETYIAKNNANSKLSSSTIKNTYKNGAHWQILDNTTQQVLWQTDNVNERGQLTKGKFGNGLIQNNTYVNFGLPVNFKTSRIIPSGRDAAGQIATLLPEDPEDPEDPFDPTENPEPNTESVIDLGFSFNLRNGNLTSRTNSLFNTNEAFKYDDLERLIEWGAPEEEIIHNNAFTGSVDGFTAVNGANVVAFVGKLRVNTTASQSGAQKLIMNNVESDTKFKINVTVNKNTTNKIRIVVVETNTTTGISTETLLGLANEGAFTATHTVTQNSNVYLRVDKSSTSTDVGTLTYFNLDNLVITKISTPTQQYDNKGRITKNKLGTYNYTNSAKQYQNTSVAVTSEAESFYTPISLQTVSYNTFKSPVKIEVANVDKVNFIYNEANQRSIMYYGSLDATNSARLMRKYYSTDGAMEIKYNTNTGATEFVTYIGGDGYTAPVVLKSDGATQEYLYLHRDYQGTILAVTDNDGDIVEKRLFDAWGNVTKVEDGSGNILTKLTVLDRGYTGHEHLQSVGLIHMNGRLYDPKLHRFLQPDNFIQDPYNTQNYNRYGYVLNNPLKYTDPSGEFLVAAIVVGAIIAATTYTLTALLADVPFTVDGFATATFIGGLSGAASFGIGSAAECIKQIALRMVFQAVAHGLSQGVIGGLQGGNTFWQSFASGAISSLASSLYSGGKMTGTKEWKGLGGAFGHKDFGILAFGTVSGGAGAALTGGNFWQGAATGLVVSGLNHYAHNVEAKIEAKRNINKEVDAKYREKADSPAPVTQATVDEMVGGLPTLSIMHDNSQGLKLNANNNVDVSSQGAEAHYFTNEQGATNASSGHYVELYRSSFTSYRHLAHNIVHEFGHAFSMIYGNFAFNYNKNRGNWDKTMAQDELFAYDFAAEFGVPYGYGYIINSRFLKQN